MVNILSLKCFKRPNLSKIWFFNIQICQNLIFHVFKRSNLGYFSLTMSKFAKNGQILIIQVLSGRNWSIFWVLSVQIRPNLVLSGPNYSFLGEIFQFEGKKRIVPVIGDDHDGDGQKNNKKKRANKQPNKTQWQRGRKQSGEPGDTKTPSLIQSKTFFDSHVCHTLQNRSLTAIIKSLNCYFSTRNSLLSLLVLFWWFFFLVEGFFFLTVGIRCLLKGWAILLIIMGNCYCFSTMAWR